MIHGSPAQAEIWKDLDRVLKTKFLHASGIELSVACTCVDSGGHHTQAVYAYVKKRQLQRVFAIKGASQAGKPLIGKWSRNNSLRIKLFPVGTDTAKQIIYSRLNITELGAGYCHFPAHYEEEYFRQLTAERVITRFQKGFPVRVWEKPAGMRNEALDCRVYGFAALHILNPNLAALASELEEKSMNIKPKAETLKKTVSGGWIHTGEDWL